MIAVTFEVVSNEKRKDEYLNIAKALRPEQEIYRDFISIERFQSLLDPEKFFCFHSGKLKKVLGNDVTKQNIETLNKREEIQCSWITGYV